MNQQSIDRRISRCEKQLNAADSERTFYSDVKHAHQETAKRFLEARKILYNAYESLINTEYLPEGLVLFPVHSGGYWKVDYRVRQSSVESLVDWSQQHQTATDKISNFYEQKTNLLRARLAMLKTQRDYEQQPVA